MKKKYSIGLDYGTNSVRALIVDTADGSEIASSVWNYAHGENAILLSRDPHLARQHPADYLTGAEVALRTVVRRAKKSRRGFDSSQIVGLGVDTTGSTPLPLDAQGVPLALDRR